MRRQPRNHGRSAWLQVRVSPAQHRAVRTAARRARVTMSRYVAEAIDAFGMRHQCGWCMEPQDDRGPIRPGQEVTTGLCLSCLDGLRAELERTDR